MKCLIFLIGKGNKVAFTHIIVYYMGKQYAENQKRNTAPLLHNWAQCITPISHENG